MFTEDVIIMITLCATLVLTDLISALEHSDFFRRKNKV